MTPPLLGVLQGHNNASLAVSSTSMDDDCEKTSELKEHNYMGLSDSSSVDSSAISGNSVRDTGGANLKVTELRLGLPGSVSPERNTELSLQSPGKLSEKPLFPFLPSKEESSSLMALRNNMLGNKRGFSDAMEELSKVKNTVFVEGNWMFPAAGSGSETERSVGQGKFPIKSTVNLMLSRPSLNPAAKSVSVKDHSGSDPATLKEILPSKGFQEMSRGVNGTSLNQIGPATTGNQPSAKAQVVGWPPIRSFRKNTLAAASKNEEVDGRTQVVGWPPVRSFRKNTLATTSKNEDVDGRAQVVGWPPVRSFRKSTLDTTSKNEEVDGKPGPGTLYVKVSMDGAPYLRKVDLRTYSSYYDLSSALEKMFGCFTIGQCGSHGARGREKLSESKLRDLLDGSEYVLAYEDKDLDWMLVGDVPWEMFIDSCKRLRIMKSSDAIGLAPRSIGKGKDMK